MDYANPKNSGIVKFPSAKWLISSHWVSGRLRQGRTEIRDVRALKDFRRAYWIWHKENRRGEQDGDVGRICSTYFRERVDGQMALLTLPDMKEVSRVQLPLDR